MAEERRQEDGLAVAIRFHRVQRWSNPLIMSLEKYGPVKKPYNQDSAPVAQKAKLGFKLLLLEWLNENLKQKHF